MAVSQAEVHWEFVQALYFAVVQAEDSWVVARAAVGLKQVL